MMIVQPVFNLLYGIFQPIGLIFAHIANRIALDAYVFYHTYRATHMGNEINNLTQAINELNKGNEAVQNLQRIQLGNIVQRDSDKKALLEALKTHRFWLLNLHSGVAANEDLSSLINAYLLTSPRKPTARKLNFDGDPDAHN